MFCLICSLVIDMAEVEKQKKVDEVIVVLSSLKTFHNVFLYVCLSLSFYMSVYLSVCLSTCLSYSSVNFDLPAPLEPPCVDLVVVN